MSGTTLFVLPFLVLDDVVKSNELGECLVLQVMVELLFEEV